MIITSDLVPNDSLGTISLAFSVTSYYDDKGLYTPACSVPYPLELYGFSTEFTRFKTNDMVWLGLSDIYSTDSRIDSDWIRLKLERAMFDALPSDYSFSASNVIVQHLNNSWTDPNIAFGTIRCSLTLNNVYTKSGIGSYTDTISISGFKMDQSSTQQLLTQIELDKHFDIFPSQVYHNPTLYEALVIDGIVNYHNQQLPIFTQLQPQVSALSFNDVMINDILWADDKQGVLGIDATLSDAVSWQNGYRLPLRFELVITGWNHIKPTKFSNNRVLEVSGCQDIYPSQLTPVRLSELVSRSIHKLVDHWYFSDSDYEVVITSVDDMNQSVRFNLILNQWIDAELNVITQSPLIGDFVLRGDFKGWNYRYTTFSAQATPIIWQALGWDSTKTFKEQVLYDAAYYEGALTQFLLDPAHLALVFDNIHANGYTTTLEAVELSYNHHLKEIELAISLHNCLGFNGTITSKTFYRPLKGFRTIPQLDISQGAKTLDDGFIQSLVFKHQPNLNDFKDEIAYHIYENIKYHYLSSKHLLPPYVIHHWHPKFPSDGSVCVKTHHAIKDTITTKPSHLNPLTHLEVDKQGLNEIFMVNSLSGLKWVYHGNWGFNSYGLNLRLIAMMGLIGGCGLVLIACINIAIRYYYKDVSIY